MPAHDEAARRKVKRGAQKQKGVWLYVTASELETAGYRDGELPDTYRTWTQSRGSLLVRLYRAEKREKVSS